MQPPPSFPRKDAKPLSYWGNRWWNLVDSNSPQSRLIVLISILHHTTNNIGNKVNFDQRFSFYAFDVNNKKVFMGVHPVISNRSIENSEELIFSDPHGTGVGLTVFGKNPYTIDATWLVEKTCIEYLDLAGV
jgi:hypothetical protein